MTPYTGPWTKAEAAHLLRRTVFGATNQQILDVVSNGMQNTVSSILQIPAINPPLAYLPEETIVATGSTWVNSVYPSDNAAKQACDVARRKSLSVWINQNMNEGSLNIAEKMVLFWQNHFGVIHASDSRTMYKYLMLLRQNALGNFKQLIKDVTIEPSMLLFLNGSSNTVNSPNENYARELLELFSIGKGTQIATGDYSTYTEDDVAAGAKILTGFKITGLKSDTLTEVTTSFNPLLHDNSSKQLSYHFNNQIINANGEQEYEDFIDVIFSENQVATHICKKLYIYFVSSDLSPTVLSDIIPSLAATLISNNYEILPVLNQLFTSEHFYDITVRGAIIRSPYEMVYGILNATGSTPNFDFTSNSESYLGMFNYLTNNLGQDYQNPPSVSGWTSYYQSPSFSKLWINSFYIKKRFDFVDSMVNVGFSNSTSFFKINLLGFLDGLSVPNDPSIVINDICEIFFPKEISATDKLYLKSILTNGLPDFEWTDQYTEYIIDASNPVVADPVKLRIRLVLKTVLKMPQYQTI